MSEDESTAIATATAADAAAAHEEKEVEKEVVKEQEQEEEAEEEEEEASDNNGADNDGANDAPNLLDGLDISKVMSSVGPVVRCVVLRAPPPPPAAPSDMSVGELKRELTSLGGDASKCLEREELVTALRTAREAGSANGETTEDDHDPAAEGGSAVAAVPLAHLIEEMDIDTTPRKSMASQILGGEFTFLGQYEEEGIVIMCRRQDDGWDDDDENEKAKEKDGSDVPPPVNEHRLQPPLHNRRIRGDILLLRVAETEETLDEDDDDGDDGGGKAAAEGETKAEGTSDPAKKAEKKIEVPTNEEFFLSYTKAEYLTFAARTDIVAKEEESDEEDDEEGGEEEDENEEDDDDDDDEDGDFDLQDNDEYDLDSEDHQVGMMNIILGQILRKFHEENGRGPGTLELLEIRKALADKLGVAVPPVDEETCDWERVLKTPGKKRQLKSVVIAEEANECGDDEGEEGAWNHGDGESEEAEEAEEESSPPSAGQKRPVSEEAGAGEEAPPEGSNKKARVEKDGGTDENGGAEEEQS